MNNLFINNSFTEKVALKCIEELNTKAVFTNSLVSGKNAYDGKLDASRTSKECYVDNCPFTKSILDASLAKVVDKIKFNGSSSGWTVIRYTKGDKFLPHYDDPKDLVHGRKYTVMVGLKKAKTGGATVFPNLGDKRYVLDGGDILCWQNYGNERDNLLESLHGGEEVLTGEKTVAVCWLMDNEPLTAKEIDFVPNFITEEERIGLLKELMGLPLLETEKGMKGGGGLPYAEQMLREKLNKVKEITKLNLVPANSYSRIYSEGATLKPHVDREGLDVTISVVVSRGLSNKLYAKKKNGQVFEFDTKIRDGIFVLGRETEHWRQEFTNTNGQLMLCVFFHYTIVK